MKIFSLWLNFSGEIDKGRYNLLKYRVPPIIVVELSNKNMQIRIELLYYTKKYSQSKEKSKQERDENNNAIRVLRFLLEKIITLVGYNESISCVK